VVAPLSGSSAAWHHVANVALHATNVVLLVAVLRLLGAGAWGAGLAAVIFAVHPTTVEPVAWISGRGDLLCATFVLAGVAAFLRLVGGGGGAWAVVVPLCGVGAALAKETGVAFPLVIAGLWIAVSGVAAGLRAGARAEARSSRRSGTVDVATTEDRAGRADGVTSSGVARAGFRCDGRGRARPLQTEGEGWSLPLVGTLLASCAVSLAAGWVAWQGSAVTTSLPELGRGAVRVGLVAVNALVLRLPAYSLRRWAQEEPWLVAGAAVVMVLATAAFAVWVWCRGGARRVGVVSGLCAAAFAPLLPLSPFGWAADRHAYLPLALLLVGGSVVLSSGVDARLELSRSRARILLGAVAALAIVAGALGVARTALWVENARLAASWCQSFRAQSFRALNPGAAGSPGADRPQLDPAGPLVVVGFPALRSGAPVFSNDLARALAFCRDGRLGTERDVLAVGALELPAGVADPGSAVEASWHPGEGDGDAPELELRARSGHFGRAPGAVGERFVIARSPAAGLDLGAGALVVGGVDSAGDLVAFRLEIAGRHAPQLAAEPRVLVIAPGGFRSLP
jgi:hypothetical protein